MTSENDHCQPTLRQLLAEELAERTKRNPSYSLRSFARHLGVDAPSLYRIIKGQRIISRSMFARLAEKLELNSEDCARFEEELRIDWAIGRRASERPKSFEVSIALSKKQFLEIKTMVDAFNQQLISLEKISQKTTEDCCHVRLSFQHPDESAMETEDAFGNDSGVST